ncbi:MAG: hypothetical protein CYG59_20010 [Chloroflexi bacterium]|nr:MAG: hypothetical protein CYG59_20010 [Chloroflexota bacterium]
MRAIREQAVQQAWTWLERLRPRARSAGKPRDFETDAHRQAVRYGSRAVHRLSTTPAETALPATTAISQ